MLRLSDLTVVAFVDPAGGKKKARKRSSRSADVVLGCDPEGRLFVLHAWAGRVPTTTHTDKIFALVERWHPRVIGIDSSAMQSLYSDSLTREARQRGRRLPLLPVVMQGDKDERIRTAIEPALAEGRLFIRDDQKDLRLELEAFPGGMTLDLCDALGEAIKLAPKRAGKIVRREEGAAWLQYLRESGAPPSYVQQCERSLMEVR